MRKAYRVVAKDEDGNIVESSPFYELRSTAEDIGSIFSLMGAENVEVQSYTRVEDGTGYQERIENGYTN